MNRLRLILKQASLSHVLKFILSPLILLVFSSALWAGELSYLDKRFTQSTKTGLLLQMPNGQMQAEKSSDTLRTPASTTKLLTGYLALEHWGRNHQFSTPFYLRDNGDYPPLLVIKGFGDPFMVSEELKQVAHNVAAQLKAQNIQQLSGLLLDTQYYVANPTLPGRSPTANPYDAIPSALAVNFNTVYVRMEQGVLVSAEAQTPLTATAAILAKPYLKQIKKKERFNTGNWRQMGERNYAELLTIFLNDKGISILNAPEWEALTEQDQLIYTHKNSKTLEEIVASMMKYSTNFIANQLALNLSAETLGAPASPKKLLQFYEQTLHRFNWQNARIEEGAGLSSKNRLSPQQLVDLLERFSVYKDLLPEVEPNVFAKTGTLFGVSTLAGYILQDNEYWPFALMMNTRMPYQYRNVVAKQLRDSLPKNIATQELSHVSTAP